MHTYGKTRCRVEKMIIPTYPEPGREKLPIYCENRCHQRTCGRVYPNAVVSNVVRDHKVDQSYTAVVLENDYIELIILPELGGRIFGARDKTNGYDFFYRQHVIKPALIGMLGSWLSGGAEFNWPMHHRPSTYMPTDFAIDERDDGSVTVWLSEHEPLDRMKGMVGIKLCPNKAMFETVARVFNRTELPQTFLWWENIAVPVNEDYQVFFPQDVNHVHFHRKQSVAEYPVTRPCMYNGKDYREGGRDIRWHKNTRDATSYFSAASRYDFFGGFDHGRNAGVVHVANHHISPGKKLFTWAYGQLSESWETALTDSDGAYAELMAGCYSDNQPDFTWLEVGESKQFSQFWYPIKDLGEPLNANTRAAFNFSTETGVIKIYAVEDLGQTTVEVSNNGAVVGTMTADLSISTTTEIQMPGLKGLSDQTARVRLLGADGKELLSFCRADLIFPDIPAPRPVDPSPYGLNNPEDLYLAGLHMKQYRDALTKPDVYWRRALEINPLHYPSLVGLGLSALNACRIEDAEARFREAIAIQTRYNPNPRDGEAFYLLGVALKQQGRVNEAYEAFYKATWNYRWRSPGHYALATIDCIRGAFETARGHLHEALNAYAGSQKARNLLAAVERKLGGSGVAIAEETLRLDPLDYWAINEAGRDFFGLMSSDPSQTILDITCEYIRAGLFDDARDLLARFTERMDSVSPMVRYTLGWVQEKLGHGQAAAAAYEQARAACPDYCFPSRLEELQILRHVVDSRHDQRAAYYLGNLLYGKEHYEDAIAQWEAALKGGETYYVLYRNLGMACYNNRRDNARALTFMQKAFELNPVDAHLVFDLCHLLQLTHAPVEERIRLLEGNAELVQGRDSLYQELVRAYNEKGDCGKALGLLGAHVFTPCEGGEHALIEQYMFAHFKLGRQALADGRYEEALGHFREGQVYPKNLGAGVWNINVTLPCMVYEAMCLDAMGDAEGAASIYRFIAGMGTDDFTAMYQPAVDVYRSMAYQRLGEADRARALLEACMAKWEAQRGEPGYGYFQLTPFFLSLHEEQNDVRIRHYSNLLGLAQSVLGQPDQAREQFRRVLRISPGHLMAGLENSMLAC